MHINSLNIHLDVVKFMFSTTVEKFSPDDDSHLRHTLQELWRSSASSVKSLNFAYLFLA